MTKHRFSIIAALTGLSLIAAPVLAPMTEDTISRAYDILLKMGVWDPNDALLNKQAGDETVAEMVRFGVITKAVPFETWANDRYVKAAVSELGSR